MSSPPSLSPVECFAKAIHFVSLAAVSNTRIAELVPKVAECFYSVSKQPNAKVPIKLSCSSANTIFDVPAATESHVKLLHRAISVLSLCAADCPEQVSILIPIVSVFMIPMDEVPSFPSTIDDGEIKTCILGRNDDNNMELVDRTLTHGRQDEAAQPGIEEQRKEEGHQPGQPKQVDRMTDDEFFQLDNLLSPEVTIKDLMKRAGPPYGNAPKTVFEATRLAISDVDGKELDQDLASSPSHASSCSFNASDSCDNQSPTSTMSHDSSQEIMKRRHRSDDLLSDRIPKKSKRHSTEPSDTGLATVAYGYKSTLSFALLLERFNAWKKFLNFKPTQACLPKDTYLAVIVTNTADSELLQTYKDENDCNSDVAAYLSVTKIVLIQRQDDTRAIMRYSISNLHKYPHGTLLINSEQERYFKEATRHLEVKVVKRGSDFEDTVNGIYVRYNDPDHMLNRLIGLLPKIAPIIDSSNSSARNVPSVSCGWSTANANEYKNNRINMVGSIAPFLTGDAIFSLDNGDKESIPGLVCSLLKSFTPCGRNPTPFFHSDPTMRMERAKMAKEFVRAFVGDQKYVFF